MVDKITYIVMKIRYWHKSRGYERLDLDGSVKKANSGRRNVKRVKVDPTRKRRFWRKFTKLRVLKRASPKKLLTWLRDAYVNMMLRLANSPFIESSHVYGDYGYGSGLAFSREYDEKKLVEIYKSMLMAQGTLVHRDPPKLSADSTLVSPLG